MLYGSIFEAAKKWDLRKMTPGILRVTELWGPKGEMFPGRNRCNVMHIEGSFKP